MACNLAGVTLRAPAYGSFRSNREEPRLLGDHGGENGSEGSGPILLPAVELTTMSDHEMVTVEARARMTNPPRPP